MAERGYPNVFHGVQTSGIGKHGQMGLTDRHRLLAGEYVGFPQIDARKAVAAVRTDIDTPRGGIHYVKNHRDWEAGGRDSILGMRQGGRVGFSQPLQGLYGSTSVNHRLKPAVIALPGYRKGVGWSAAGR